MSLYCSGARGPAGAAAGGCCGAEPVTAASNRTTAPNTAKRRYRVIGILYRSENEIIAQRCLNRAVLGSGDDFILKRPRQVTEVVAVAGNAHDQVTMVFRIVLGFFERVGGDDVEL